MTVRFNAAVLPYIVNYSSPPVQDSVSFRLDNNTGVLLQLAVFDYEQWVTTENSNREQDLFCIDASTDNTESAQGNLALTTNDLYLVRAYFEGGENIDMIIQKSDKSEAIHLKIVMVMGEPAFEHNDTYEVFSFREG